MHELEYSQTLSASPAIALQYFSIILMGNQVPNTRCSACQQLAHSVAAQTSGLRVNEKTFQE
jgi:hypothetical protein